MRSECNASLATRLRLVGGRARDYPTATITELKCILTNRNLLVASMKATSFPGQNRLSKS